MQVEFRDELLQLGHPAHRVLIGGTLNNPVRSWLGKGFRRVDSETGRGYNYFHRPGRGDRFTFPMLTRLSLSALDEQPVFGLIYWAFASPVGAVNMIDEVRRFPDNVYLGFEFCVFTAGQRTVPIPFLLHGPRRRLPRATSAPWSVASRPPTEFVRPSRTTPRDGEH